MKSKKEPAMLPHPPNFVTRAELSDGRIDEIGTGRVLEEEIDMAKSYASRTSRKIWIVNLRTGRTVYRIERAHAAGSGR